MPTKKTVKKAKKKVIAKKVATAKPTRLPRRGTSGQVGAVTHFYSHISVAIVKFKKVVKAGIKLHYKGATTDFAEVAKSMQFDHKAIASAKKGQEVGIKVKKKVREGDEVYEAAE